MPPVPAQDRLKIVVGSVFSLPPFSPGISWDWIHLVLGLRALGHDVYFVEEVEPRWCRDAQGGQSSFERSVNRAYFLSAMERFGLLDRACQLYDGGERTAGLGLRELTEELAGADLLINISGHVKTDFVLGAARRRVYFDQDPVFTQLWIAEYGAELNFGPDDVLLTVGLNIGTPHSPVPDCGLRWHHCLPAVMLEHWPADFDAECARITTIASWGSYSALQYQGSWYGSKREEFRRFADLPRLVDQELEIALKSPPGDPDAALLESRGWNLVDAGRIDTLAKYQEYVAGSRAEIGIAKEAYVKGNSGWFSDRAAHYLASGKPVLAQSTGIERCLPTGSGLLTFATPAEAAAAIEEVNRDYRGHCRAAREFAAEFLDYRKVLPEVVELAMSPATATA
jgi:hypothetical protein